MVALANYSQFMKTTPKYISSSWFRILALLVGVRWIEWVRAGSGYRALASLALMVITFLLTVYVGTVYGRYLDVVGYNLYERLHNPYAPITVVGMMWTLHCAFAAFLWATKLDNNLQANVQAA